MKDKVILTYYDAEDNVAQETLWIDKLENRNYQIKNIPFFAPNIAYNDIITVEDDEGILYFLELVESSEHSTIQIIFYQNEYIAQTIKNIEALNCSWEGMSNQEYLTIDIPPAVNYTEIKEYLHKNLDKKIFDYKEACLSKTHSANL